MPQSEAECELNARIGSNRGDARPAATAAAAPPLEPPGRAPCPRIARGSEMRIVRGDAVGELVEIVLPRMIAPAA